MIMLKTFDLKKRIKLLLLLLAVSLMLTGCLGLWGHGPCDVQNCLVVLHTNDHHGHPLAFSDCSCPGQGGLSARATLVNKVRANFHNVMVLDAGDFNTGMPESNFFKAKPDIEGYNFIGYDAVAIGNHEFDVSMDEMHKQIDINAFRSSLVDDCIERGLSLIEGGSVYSADGGPTAGQVSSGDSLAALEAVVFKDKILTREQVFNALKTNFEDETTTPTGEQIRNILINKAPKYGNDNYESDKWSIAITEYLGSTYSSEFHNSRYGKGPIPGTYGFGQSPVTGNVAFGGFIGALPNGKKAGKPVNNGISPDNGTEINGITAAMNSVASMPSIWFQKGAIYNARLTEDTLSEQKGIDRISSLVFAFFKKNGIQVQFNVVGSETLKEARIKPEEYSDLMVRVSGYSALFTPLDPAVQEDIIERAEFKV